MARVLEMPRGHLYGDRPAPPPQPTGTVRPQWQRRGPVPPAPLAPTADAATTGVRRALLNLQYTITDIQAQAVRQVGPRPGRHEVALRACIGLVPECEFGPYNSKERASAEQELLGALALWASGEGAARPTGEAGCGWTLECKWAGGRGTRRAALDIRPVGGPTSAAMQQLRHWLSDASIRLPLPRDPEVTVVVPCHACPGELPLGQVQVTLRGLPTSFMLKDTTTAILRGVGYTGLPGAGRKLLVTEVFRGWHSDEPHLADGSLCAFVDQPEDDPELRRLPSTIHLGHNQAVLEVHVSSRHATFITSPAAPAPAAAAPTGPPAPPPPPPPAHPPPAQPPPARPPPAQPPRQPAWGRHGQVPAPAPALDATTRGPADMVTPEAEAEANAGTTTPAVASTSGARAVLATSIQEQDAALLTASAARPAVARLVTEWANDAFGHTATPEVVRHVLAEAVAASTALRGQVARMAAQTGELDWTRPPEAMERQLIVAFAKAGHSMATWEEQEVHQEGARRRSARLQPAATAARGRSPARGSSADRAARQRARRRRSALAATGAGRSRSRSQGSVSE